VKRTYTLGGESYATKAAVTTRCQSILYGRLPMDWQFLADVLAMHPEAEHKIGVGVARFYVDADGFGGVCFWLERVDGSKTDWSFRACLKAPTHEQEVRSALRRLIADHVVSFRDAAVAIDPVCAITGARVTASTAHVDHKPPHTFLALVERFLRERGLSYPDVAVRPTEDGSTVTELLDGDLAEAWRVFHAQEAVLQLTSARANLSQGQGLR